MIRLALSDVLTRKGITRYELSKLTKINYAIIDNYYKNKVVRYDSDLLNRICNALHCDIADIIIYTPDE